ncbi:hypothetical protein BH10BDE1_BH10BDE1_03770 [soil metagenome]
MRDNPCTFFATAVFFSCAIFFGGASQATGATDLKIGPINWNGDMRFRFVQLRESVDDPRLYQQIRARLGFRADVQDDLTAVFRLATATSAISNNQTLGDAKEPGMPRRSFGVDLAYGDWKFLESGRLLMGRLANPFYAPGRTQLVFDSDLTFEGVSAGWQPKWTDSNAFLNLGAFIISENYATTGDVVDTGLVAVDLGYSLKTEFGQWTAHVARYHYLNIQNRPVTSIEKDAKTDAYSYPNDRVRGNTVYPNDPLAAPADRKYYYSYDFVQTEVGIEWKMETGAFDILAYGDFVANERAGANGEAHEYGLSLKYGRVQLLIAKGTKRSDSVIGGFTDSDFNGGGTDNRGTKYSVSYALSDFSSMAFTDYEATRGIDSVARDYYARHLDFSLQF